jgi:limonene-1,2-epoxide hydrolase
MDAASSLGRRGFLAATGVGAAALAMPRVGTAAELTPAERANVAIVNEMCAAWAAPLDFTRIGRYFVDDCTFRGSETSPPIKGRQAMADALTKMLGTAQRAEIQVVQSFARGPIVFNERYDRFTLGERKIDWHGVGVFFLKDGKIVEWSDFQIKT